MVDEFTPKRLRLAAIAVVLLLVQVASAGAQAEPSNVLILYSFRKDSPAISLLNQKIRQQITDRPDAKLYEEYMDLPSFDEAEQSRLLRQYLQGKYARLKIDAFVSFGNAATRFLLANGPSVFPNSRSLSFLAQDDALIQELRNRKISGAYYSYEVRRSLKLAQQLFPSTRQVFVVGGTAPEDQLPIEIARRAEREFKGSNLTFTYLTNLTVPDLLSRVSSLPQDSIVLFTGFSKDASGSPFLAVNVGAMLAASSSAPVFSSIDSFLGTGILGGWMYNTSANGEYIAHLALAAIDGTLPTDHAEIVPAIATPTFDERVLERWRIPANALPPESIVLFKSPGFWEQYKWHVMAASGVMAFQAVLIGILVLERAKRRKEERELREMTERVVRVQDEERRRIARELHDGTSQNIFAVNINLSVLQQTARGTAAEQERLVECRNLCERSLEELRMISYRLHPPDLGSGFDTALRTYADGISKRSDIQIELNLDKNVGDLPAHLERELFRIVQESLANVIRHSGSKTAIVRLERKSNDIVLQIRDFGKGIQKAVAATVGGGTTSMGVGIPGMRERVRYLQGRFEVESGADGTTVRVTVPAAPVSS